MLIYEGARKGGKNITFTKQSVKELDQKISLIPLSYDIVFKGVFKRNLDLLKKFLNVTPDNTIAIGDGANDLSMFKFAKKRVAFCAKPILKENANIIIDKKDLTLILEKI